MLGRIIARIRWAIVLHVYDKTHDAEKATDVAMKVFRI